MSVKISRYQILLWMFIISTFMDGILWELVGWMSLLTLYVMFKNNIKFMSILQRKIPFCAVLICAVAYVILQIYILELESSYWIRLYGITKNVVTILIVYLFLDCYMSRRDIIMDSLPLLLLLNGITAIYLVMGNKGINIIGGSRNYLGAIDVMLMPYIFKVHVSQRKGLIRFVWFITIVLLSLFSGSRTLMATAVIAFASIMLMEGNISKKIKYFLIGGVLVVIVFVMSSVFGVTENFARARSVFYSISDQARYDLMESAFEQFNSYSHIEKLIGNGNNLIIWREAPPHNVVLEILLCYGIIGLIFWGSTALVMIICIIKANNTYKKYALLVIFLALIIGFVQPFITTGYTFQVIMSFSVLYILKLGIREGRP